MFKMWAPSAALAREDPKAGPCAALQRGFSTQCCALIFSLKSGEKLSNSNRGSGSTSGFHVVPFAQAHGASRTCLLQRYVAGKG